MNENEQHDQRNYLIWNLSMEGDIETHLDLKSQYFGNDVHQFSGRHLSKHI